jgi:hypothetical protein
MPPQQQCCPQPIVLQCDNSFHYRNYRESDSDDHYRGCSGSDVLSWDSYSDYESNIKISQIVVDEGQEKVIVMEVWRDIADHIAKNILKVNKYFLIEDFNN